MWVILGGPTYTCISTECKTRFLLSGVTGQMDVLHISVRKAVPDECTRTFTNFFIIMMPRNQYGILFVETSRQRRFINSVHHREQWPSSSKTACLLNIFNVVKLWACKWCVFRFVLSLVKSVKLTRCTNYLYTCRNTLRNIVRVVCNTRHCQHAPETLEPTFRRFRKIAKMTICFVMSMCLSVRLSVRPSAWNNSAPTERI